MNGTIDKIVIHCSDSPQGRGDTAETIHRWHLDRGWSGVGYHYVILEDGQLEMGRPEYWKGAHVRRFNKGSIGICLIGDGDYTNEQIRSLVNLKEDLCSRYPEALWYNHYELDSAKTCPNADLVAVIDAR